MSKTAKNIKKEFVDHSFIFVEVPSEIVGPEAILWSESAWWPKKIFLQYIRQSNDNLQVGSKFHKKFALPLCPQWNLEVKKIVPESEIEWTYLNGTIQGYEVLKIEGRSNGTRIDFELHGRIKGILNKILWALIYKKLHAQNIKIILNALKEYVTAKYDSLRSRYET